MEVPSTSSNERNNAQQSEVQDSEDLANKEAQQNENLRRQLRMLQTEEKSLNSVLLELRSTSRKLNLEKYRLLELCKERQGEVEEPNQAPPEQEQPRQSSYDTFSF
jgi:transposase-like protein